jgi:hypothetical protein
LVDQVLFRRLRRHWGLSESEPGRCEAIEGMDFRSEVVNKLILSREGRYGVGISNAET